MEKAVKVWTVDEIKDLILTNDKALYGALKQLYLRQTEDEKKAADTFEHNGVGFSAYDAEFMTSVAQFYLKTGFLTESQKRVTRRKILKYSKQLVKIANKEI